jgi:hypothetical protein
MSLTNKISYTILSEVIPRDVFPLDYIAQDGVAYGTCEIQLPITVVNTITASVKRATPPTSEVDVWLSMDPELYDPSNLTYSIAQLSNGNWVITWRFYPAAIPLIDNGQYFLISFYVNSNLDPAIPSAQPKLCIAIKNSVSDAGAPWQFNGFMEGYSGFSGYSGKSGYSGISGYSGYSG